MTRTASAVIAALIALSGCASSPPLHYYTLSQGTAASRRSAPGDAIPVRIDRVTVPDELDRTQLVRRLDATSVQILENERWAAPLEDMIHRVLSDDLAARLPAGLVVDPNQPAMGEPQRTLSVDIQEFVGDASCAVLLRAAWTLKQSKSQSLRASEEVRIPGSAGCVNASALPVAMSQSLAQLSDRIADRISGATPPENAPASH